MTGTLQELMQRCDLQMRLAFWRGVAILKELDSDGSQHQESTATSSNLSRDTEGFSEVPKNMTLLEPVIGKLLDKVGSCRQDHLIHLGSLYAEFSQGRFCKIP
jgi:hypothetical protein